MTLGIDIMMSECGASTSSTVCTPKYELNVPELYDPSTILISIRK